MHELNCPGWNGSTITAWLAAIGATHLDRDLRLRWTTDAEPYAVLSCADGAPPLERLVSAWPSAETLSGLPSASLFSETVRDGGKTSPSGRKITLNDFAAMVSSRRGDAGMWTLSSTMTDLSVDDGGLVSHAPFDPPMSKGPSLHMRLVDVYDLVEDVKAQLDASLSGRPLLAKRNGLAFTIARIGSPADAHKNLVDPVLEVLAFFGLSILPFRGDGKEGRNAGKSARQRGWARDGKRTTFRWPAWKSPLDLCAIDALLDIWQIGHINDALLQVHDAWEAVCYKRRSTNDSTRGFSGRSIPVSK